MCFLPSTHYSLYDFDLRATHARTLLPAALASVSFGFVLARVRIRFELRYLRSSETSGSGSPIIAVQKHESQMRPERLARTACSLSRKAKASRFSVRSSKKILFVSRAQALEVHFPLPLLTSTEVNFSEPPPPPEEGLDLVTNRATDWAPSSRRPQSPPGQTESLYFCFYWFLTQAPKGLN